MESVMRQPHAKTERHKRICVMDDEWQPSALYSSPGARDPSCGSKQNGRLDDEEAHEEHCEHWRFTSDMQQMAHPVLDRVHRTDHAERIHQSAEAEDEH